MPRSMVTDPDVAASVILFGTKLQPVNLNELSRLTGITASTLYRYKKEPKKIPLDRLCRIVQRRGINDQELRRLMAAYKGR